MAEVNGDVLAFDQELDEDVPLWKQFYHIQREKDLCHPTEDVNREKHEAQQKFLSHMKDTREAKGLPPFFAVISGPTLPMPFRMEGLKATMGRNTRAQKYSDIHLPGTKKIAHTHITIEYCEENSCFFLTNHSRNGILIKTNDSFSQFTALGQKIALSNPAVFDVQGVLLYFQVFYIAPRNESIWNEYTISKEEADSLRVRAPRKVARPSQPALELTVAPPSTGHDDENGPATPQFEESDDEPVGPPATKRRKRDDEEKDDPPPKPVTERSKPYKGEVSYSEMIKRALVGLGGSGTQKEIGDYIAEHFSQYLVKSTWRKAVSGILSSNPKFRSEPCLLSTGKRARFCTWRLLDDADELKKKYGGQPEQTQPTQGDQKGKGKGKATAADTPSEGSGNSTAENTDMTKTQQQQPVPEAPSSPSPSPSPAPPSIDLISSSFLSSGSPLPVSSLPITHSPLPPSIALSTLPPLPGNSIPFPGNPVILPMGGGGGMGRGMPGLLQGLGGGGGGVGGVRGVDVAGGGQTMFAHALREGVDELDLPPHPSQEALQKALQEADPLQHLPPSQTPQVPWAQEQEPPLPFDL